MYNILLFTERTIDYSCELYDVTGKPGCPRLVHNSGKCDQYHHGQMSHAIPGLYSRSIASGNSVYKGDFFEYFRGTSKQDV